MTTRNSIAIAALAATLAMPAAARPADPAACGVGDLSGVVVLDCTGYVAGNLLSNSPAAVAAAAAALADLGLAASDGSWIEKQDFASGSTIGFATPLYGTSYVGLHKGGAGDGGPGTAIYRIDAGQAGVTMLEFELPGLSSAALYATGPAPVPVPEPAVATLLLAGLGVIVRSARRRRRS
ncbi:MAG: PEP-CTERM sorting domain-containing protein [Burkholderiales bacterium]|nr:PEP-CTERM sorting domain-containing protein [Burkholderiales bacterium]